MKFKTTRFGELEVKKERIITFEEGLLGFEDKKRFTLLVGHQSPFLWLQSIDDPDLTFIVAEPWTFCKEYEFEISEEIQDELEIEDKEDILIINAVTIVRNSEEKPENMTMNLQAPIIINKKASLAKQIVLKDSDFSTKYDLAKSA